MKKARSFRRLIYFIQWSNAYISHNRIHNYSILEVNYVQQLTGLLSATRNCLTGESNIHGDAPKVFIPCLNLKTIGTRNVLKIVRHCMSNYIITIELVRK